MHKLSFPQISHDKLRPCTLVEFVENLDHGERCDGWSAASRLGRLGCMREDHSIRLLGISPGDHGQISMCPRAHSWSRSDVVGVGIRDVDLVQRHTRIFSFSNLDCEPFARAFNHMLEMAVRFLFAEFYP
jgi:hypothetical protein